MTERSDLLYVYTNRRYYTDLNRSAYGNMSRRDAAPQGPLILPRSQQDECFYLVDQITATLARVIVLSQESKHVWHIEVIACLSMLSAKLKVLIAKGPDIDSYLRANQDEYFYSNPKQDSTHHASSHDDPAEETFDKYGSDVGQYCRKYTEISRWLCNAMEHVLGSIGSARPIHKAVDHIDLCALIYRTGVRSDHALVYQDRWGAISGSPERLHMHWATTSLKLAFEMAKHLQSRRQVCSASGTNTVWLTAKFGNDNDSNNDSPENEIHNLGIQPVYDLITLMVPLSLASPIVGSGFSTSLRTFSALTELIDIAELSENTACVFKLRSGSNAAAPDPSMGLLSIRFATNRSSCRKS